MIQILTGKIGAGKTLHGMEFIYDALCEGRTVCSNIEMNYARLALLGLKEKGVLIQPKQIITLDLNTDPDWNKSIPWGVPGGTVLVVLDEIHLFFNARDYAKTDKLHRSMLSFLSQSRKAGVDVLFIAQVKEQIEKQFRAQAKNEIYINDFSGLHWPIFGEIPLRQNILVTRDLQTGDIMRRQKREYPKKMFGTYNTFAFLDSEMQQAADERERLEPLKLSKPKGAEKKQIVNELKKQNNEILDNNNRGCRVGYFRRLAYFFKFFRKDSRRASKGREREEKQGVCGESAPAAP